MQEISGMDYKPHEKLKVRGTFIILLSSTIRQFTCDFKVFPFDTNTLQIVTKSLMDERLPLTDDDEVTIMSMFLGVVHGRDGNDLIIIRTAEV